MNPNPMGAFFGAQAVGRTMVERGSGKAGQCAEPTDIGGAVAYLASRASDTVHGHLLLVDGAWSVI